MHTKLFSKCTSIIFLFLQLKRQVILFSILFIRQLLVVRSVGYALNKIDVKQKTEKRENSVILLYNLLAVTVKITGEHEYGKIINLQNKLTFRVKDEHPQSPGSYLQSQLSLQYEKHLAN